MGSNPIAHISFLGALNKHALQRCPNLSTRQGIESTLSNVVQFVHGFRSNPVAPQKHLVHTEVVVVHKKIVVVHTKIFVEPQVFVLEAQVLVEPQGQPRA